LKGAEAEAFDALFRNELAALVRTAYLLLGDRDEARDVAQEAFVQLYVRWRKVSGYDAPRLWLRRVAIRQAGKVAAKRKRRRSLEADVPDVRPEPSLPDEELRRAIASLPGNQRAAIVLHYYEDRSVADIGNVLGCSENTAKVHLHRARKRLASLLGEEAADVP
jgi:RNA polymerase sigma-70 factor (ECF subfamily)